MDKKVTGFQDRRRGPDPRIKFLQIAPFFAWPILFVILFVVDQAKPEAYTLLDRILNLPRHPYWDMQTLKLAFYTSVILLIFSLLSLFINKSRHRRKTDRYSYSLLITMGFSLFVIGFYLFKL